MYIRKSSLKHVVDSLVVYFIHNLADRVFFYKSESESSVDKDVRSER